MILTGTVCIFSEMAGESEPVFMEELGAGDCAGWVAALAGAAGVSVIAKTEVQGLLVGAPAFLEIARYDPALREDMFAKVRKGEVWRAVLSEMERRTGGVSSAREIVNSLYEECVTRDWPEDEELLRDQEKLWIVAGGEGVKSGDRWSSADGVLWARLVGLPADKLTKALANDTAPPPPAKESIRSRPAEPVPSSPSKVGPSGPASSAERAADSKAAPGGASEPSVRGPRRSIWRALGVAFLITTVGGGAAAWWASKQEVRESFTAAGTLTFVGERRTVAAGLQGTISEWGLKPGTRLDRGSVIAIVQPPMDEARAKSLTAAAAVARGQSDFCESALAGRPVVAAGQPKHLVELATELASLRSEQRVLSAVERGATTDYTLTAAERQRVTSMYAAARADHMDRVSSASRDAGPRRDELREAEADLRQAQEELTIQTKAFAEVLAGKDKESRQEAPAAQRALAVVKRAVTQKQEAVTKLRKEIATMTSTVEPTAQPADDASASLPAIKAGIAQIEEQMQRHADALRREAAGHEAALAKLRTDSAPRQIETLQPGLVLEAAPLSVGSTVTPDTVLGRLTTRQAWEVECRLRAADLARFKEGQDIDVVTINPDGTSMRLTEKLKVANGAVERPRLSIVSSRDDWHDGTPVRIETSVVTGSLLDRWIAEIRWGIGF